MKNGYRAALIALAGCLAAATATAGTMQFSDTEDFAGDGTYLGESYRSIAAGAVVPFGYDHTLEFGQPGMRLDSAALQLTHYGNRDTKFVEIWWVAVRDREMYRPLSLGTLSASSGDRWVTDSFALGSGVLETVSGNDPWRLEVRLFETTQGDDRLWLARSVLSGEYSTTPSDRTQPVPEPASLLLLGGGIAAAAAGKRRSGR